VTVRVAHVVLARDVSGRDVDAMLADRRILLGLCAATAMYATQSVAFHSGAVRARRVIGETPHLVVPEFYTALGVRTPTGFPRFPLALSRAVRALAPDVVHVHGGTAFPVETRLLCHVVDAPVLVQDRAGPVPDGAARRAWFRWGFARITGVAFAAQGEADRFFRAGIFRPDLPVFEVPGGSCGFSPGDRLAARAETGLTGDPALLWVGHLNQNKDPLTVLEGVARVSERLPNVNLWLVYRSAPLETGVRARVESDERLRHRVRFVGPVAHDKLEAYYRAADVFVLGSHREGSNVSSVEALACGTPIVVTDLPAFRRFADSDAVGGLWQPGDPDDFVRALVDVWERDQTALRRAARQRFDRDLSWSAIGHRLRAVYAEVMRL
jgi:glycosyltransferase involved in cell wall biosynthesis